MEDKEMKQGQIRLELTPRSEITIEQLEELLTFFKEGYGDRWAGDDHFRQVVMKNISEVGRLYSGENWVAAVGINVNRITDIAVHPDFRGRGLGGALFQEVTQKHPDAWISIGVNAEEMLRTIAEQSLNFYPLDDREKIEGLFRGLNGISKDFEIETENVTIENQAILEKLKQKGLDNPFVAFYRPGSLHGTSYKQIVFQNRSITD